MVGFYRLIKTANPSSKQPFAFSISRALIIMGAMLSCIFTATYASAANTRIELSNEDQRVFLAPFMRKIDNPSKITAHEWAQEMLPTSTKASQSNIIALGTKPQALWLRAAVTNSTNAATWHLDLGSLLEGRLGALTQLKVVNATTNTVFIDWDHSAPTPSQTTVPVTLTPNKTEEIFIAVSFKGFLPAQIVPSLVPESAIATPRISDITLSAISFLLLMATGFFLPFALIKSRWTYVSYAIYMFGNYGLITYLSHLHWNSFAYAENLTFVFTSIAATGLIFIITVASRKNPLQGLIAFSLILVSTLFIFIPMTNMQQLQAGLYAITLIAALIVAAVKFSKQKKKSTIREAKPFYYATYALAITCTVISCATYANTAFNAAWASNLFIFSMIPQIITLFIAVRIHFRQSQKNDQENEVKKNRAHHALARLQQSKDAADQARLLRVIERERELLGDLREQEIQRGEEMRRAKEEADAANAAKSAFLAVVSHEIRTPMNGIMGILKLMQDTTPTKEQSDFLLTMQKTGETMVALLNDILDFEKIENGSMELEHINIDLHSMAKGIITLMTGYIQGKNVKLLSEISPDIPRFVMGDPTRLQQVLFNLVSNALKFTEQGSVTIKLEPGGVDNLYNDQCAIKFSITDTGIGISEEGQKNLFKPFTQAEKSTARKYGGTGLGLAICMRLIKNMGSEIKIHSVINEGTTFYFTLVMDVGYNDSEQNKPLSASQAAADIKQEPAIAPLDIAIIEDNDINRKVLQSLLEKDQHTVFAYPSAEEAIEKLTSLHPDIIFTDINLLGMSGLDFTRKIRNAENMPHLKDLPIVGLTGNVRPEDLEEMKQAGLNGSIAKPIDYNKVHEILRNVTPTEKPQNTDATDSSGNTGNVTPPAAAPKKPSQVDALSAPFKPQEDSNNISATKATEAPYTPVPPQENASTLSTPAPSETPQPTPPQEQSLYTPQPQQISPLQELAHQTPIEATQHPESAAVITSNHAPSPESTQAKEPAEAPSVPDTPPETSQPQAPAPEQAPPASTESSASNDLPPENYDMTMLNSLMESLGKDTFIELVDGCLDQVDIIVAAMQEGDKQGDADYIRARMHELKGMAYNFGLKQIGDLAKIGEDSAKDGDLETALSMVTTLKNSKDQNRTDLQNWVNK